ncbi:MAG: MFS transporter [Dehalococcoidia bacterium]
MGRPGESLLLQTRGAFYLSRLLSQTGQALFLVTVFLIMGGGGHSAVGLSAVFVSMMAASILFGLPAGAVADWMGARRAFVLGAGLRALTVASAALVIDAEQWLWAVVFVYSAVSQLFSPAEMALVSVVQRSRPGMAHTALVILQYAGQGLAVLALAPALHFVGGLPLMVGVAAGINGVACVLATVCAIGTRGSGSLPVRGAGRAALDLRTTFRFIASDSRAAYAVVLLAFSQLAVKALMITLPPYVADDLDLSVVQMIVIAGVAGLGGVAGFYWTSRTLTLRVAPTALKVTLLLMVVSLLALSALTDGFVAGPGAAGFEFLQPLNLLRASSFAVPFSVAAILAMSLTVAPIGARTILTETAPRAHQARVFATQGIVTDLVVLLPILLSGLGTELAGARVTLLVLAAVGLGMFILLERVWRAAPPAGHEAPAAPA